jgi:hypothetical protein
VSEPISGTSDTGAVVSDIAVDPSVGVPVSGNPDGLAQTLSAATDVGLNLESRPNAPIL